MQKSTQLQIRVSPRDKRRIESQARRAGLSVSTWVLGRLLPHPQGTFEALCEQLSGASTPTFAYAELNDFLTSLGAQAFAAAVAERPEPSLDSERLNYLAAMVEQAAALLNVTPPPWTRDVAPLPHPVFASELVSLRLYLLVHALPPFRRRNIFVDSALGARV